MTLSPTTDPAQDTPALNSTTRHYSVSLDEMISVTVERRAGEAFPTVPDDTTVRLALAMTAATPGAAVYSESEDDSLITADENVQANGTHVALTPQQINQARTTLHILTKAVMPNGPAHTLDARYEQTTATLKDTLRTAAPHTVIALLLGLHTGAVQ